MLFGATLTNYQHKIHQDSTADIVFVFENVNWLQMFIAFTPYTKTVSNWIRNHLHYSYALQLLGNINSNIHV